MRAAHHFKRWWDLDHVLTISDPVCQDTQFPACVVFYVQLAFIADTQPVVVAGGYELSQRITDAGQDAYGDRKDAQARYDAERAVREAAAREAMAPDGAWQAFVDDWRGVAAVRHAAYNAGRDV